MPINHSQLQAQVIDILVCENAETQAHGHSWSSLWADSVAPEDTSITFYWGKEKKKPNNFKSMYVSR